MMIDLPNEDICVAMSWSGDYAQSQARANEVGKDIQLGYSVPGEGTLFFFDNLLIPADAPHPENAHRFLEFLMRPEVIAPATNLLGYANGNRASVPFIDSVVLNDPAVYPSMEERQHISLNRIYSPKAERLRSRLWSRVKAGL
jgi:putrescine transport system substrate-binding protein